MHAGEWRVVKLINLAIETPDSEVDLLPQRYATVRALNDICNNFTARARIVLDKDADRAQISSSLLDR